jgi:hypothetical protein
MRVGEDNVVGEYHRITPRVGAIPVVARRTAKVYHCSVLILNFEL